MDSPLKSYSWSYTAARKRHPIQFRHSLSLLPSPLQGGLPFINITADSAQFFMTFLPLCDRMKHTMASLLYQHQKNIKAGLRNIIFTTHRRSRPPLLRSIVPPPNNHQDAMDQMIHFEAILFPSDGRAPSLVQLMTSPMTISTHHSSYTTSPSRMPHPEIHMDYIADGIGPRAWKYQLVEALDGMNRKFTNPYIIFYPVVSRDGMPFPVNKCIREIQGRSFKEEVAWRGNIVIAKYRDNPFSSMINASMADFPLLKNYLLTHGSPSEP